MKFLTSEKTLVIVFCALFATSALFLFWKNDHELDPNLGKNWWTLSFAAPEDPKSLFFTIENHTTGSTFSYDLSYRSTPDKEISYQESVIVAPGETKTITPDIAAPENTRTSITVTAGAEKKTIYR